MSHGLTLKTLMLSDIGQTQKNKYCVIPLIGGHREGRSTEKEGRVVMARGQSRGKWNSELVSWGQSFCSASWKEFRRRLVGWLHDSVNVLHTTKLCT